MKQFYKYFLVLILSVVTQVLHCQVDTDPPIPPVLDYLTIQPSSGKIELQWTRSSSPDVAGYVLYYYTSGEGHAFDTIYDPSLTSYINSGTNSQYFIESYVIAAIDTAGNISPLSNPLNTIFPIIDVDSCNAKIDVTWNSYPSFPKKVTGYTILVTENGGPAYEAGHSDPGVLVFSLQNIKPQINYCFTIRADLEAGMSSYSVAKCREVSLERTPDWINADYATIDDNNNISLSFTIDPQSELTNYWISRKRVADNELTIIKDVTPSNNNIRYTDKSSDPSRQYYYWLNGVNRCGIPLLSSNLAGNIVLQLSEEGNIIKFRWNGYRNWNGGVADYRVYTDTGNGYVLTDVLQPSDTMYTIDYHSIMNDVTGAGTCFYIEADESSNQYGITGKSRSNQVCMAGIEKITVANAFTPDNDNLNDLFVPVLSFTPADYQLIITDRQNNKVFETKDYLNAWNGTKSGSPLPADVYLWYLKVRTPSGKVISKTGTVAIVRTR